MAPEYAGRIRFASADVTNVPDTAARFGVMGLPTLVALKNGAPVQQLVGGQKRRNIEKLIALCSE